MRQVRKTRSSRLSLFSDSLFPAFDSAFSLPPRLPKLKVLTISIVLCRDAFYFQFVSTPAAEAEENHSICTEDAFS